jgi:16S rRNA (guanine966-N2)-methyltransferase
VTAIRITFFPRVHPYAETIQISTSATNEYTWAGPDSITRHSQHDQHRNADQKDVEEVCKHPGADVGWNKFDWMGSKVTYGILHVASLPSSSVDLADSRAKCDRSTFRQDLRSFAMRIVAGTAGGLQLKSPPGADVRPTMDKVRGAILNSLNSMGVIEGASVVDLFAGSGACGIEAMSRGASSATFVERDARNADVVRDNLRSTKLDGKVVVSDVMTFLNRPHQFDVAFVDPPYAFDQWSELLLKLKATVAVCESNRPVEAESGWEVIRHKRYGGTDVTTLQREEKAA